MIERIYLINIEIISCLLLTKSFPLLQMKLLIQLISFILYNYCQFFLKISHFKEIMNAIQLSLIQALIKFFTPTSPAYGNTLAFERLQSCQQLKGKLKPGDIIFSRTNSSLYEASRKFMGMNYDHVAVILNNKEVIHISPPIIGKIDMEYIMSPNRQPLIIRPKLEDKDKFMTNLQNFLGEKYNTSAIPKIAFNQLKNKLEYSNINSFSLANLKYSRICSDAILYSLCRADNKVKEQTEKIIEEGSKFKQLGFFMPDEVANILMLCGAEIIIKSSFKEQYMIIDYLAERGTNFVNFAKKLKKTGNKNQSIQSKSKQNDSKGYINESTSSKKSNIMESMKIFQLLSLLMAFAHTQGFFINKKIQYTLLFFNTLMTIGHLHLTKNLLLNSTPKL